MKQDERLSDADREPLGLDGAAAGLCAGIILQAVVDLKSDSNLVVLDALVFLSSPYFEECLDGAGLTPRAIPKIFSKFPPVRKWRPNRNIYIQDERVRNIMFRHAAEINKEVEKIRKAEQSARTKEVWARKKQSNQKLLQEI